MGDLAAKTNQYEQMLAEALDVAEPVAPTDTPVGDMTHSIEEMSRSYLDDGRHFKSEGNLADALAAFAYGHGWLDAGVRMGLFAVPADGRLFTV